ncbi:hypothetical protein BGZ70_009478 [Mortierella alpina]|uniref:DUF676 domain-containing protein n=1 Tax=Mortierella alpina TaxID=64518 RepID=A0A9P6M0N3_MORAP|nr:hypothetical protein BGZ70_009478 [Mortierella alpina]
MSPKPLLLIQHKLSLSVGGIVRYRIKLNPDQLSNIDSLQFRIRNASPVYRNLTPGSGPWKVSVALVRNPNKTPAVPELVPFIGCAQVCRLDAPVMDPRSHSHGQSDKVEEGCNEWELEVLSEMVLQRNWVDLKVEVFAVLKECALGLVDNKNNSSSDPASGGSDVEVVPQILQPSLVSCEYKDTAAICGPTFPDVQEDQDAEGLHLVLLTHGIHGTWLDMLYIKEQIDAQNAHNGKTVTFLTDTNHAGTEEGIQMAGQRVALDILEFTGYCDTEQGKHLRRSATTPATTATPLTKASPASATLSSSSSTGSAAKNRNARRPFPRGFSKVSIIGHSLGGLINIYALGYIEDVTHGAFFNTIQPAHFISMATPLLGIGFEHPWVLGFALSLGCIGQTGKDLALEYRSPKQLKQSSSSSSSSSPPSLSSFNATKEKGTTDTETHDTTAAAATTTPTTAMTTTFDCTLDREPGPLLLAMARPGSASNRILKRFQDRTSYANIENDMAVRFKTSSMMGIPTFDMDQFFSPEGAATQPRKNLYHSAVTSTLALLFPNVPTKAKFLSIADEPSPIVVVDHVPAAAAAAAEPVKRREGASEAADSDDRARSTVSEALQKASTEMGVVNGSAKKGLFKKSKKSSKTSSSPSSSSRSSSRSSSSSRETNATKLSSSTSSSTLACKSRLELAQLVAEGYHAEMDWTKIGVFIVHEAHVQIIVRRKWYNLDGWKTVQDLVERFDFT